MSVEEASQIDTGRRVSDALQKAEEDLAFAETAAAGIDAHG